VVEVRIEKGRRGRRPLTAQREHYGRLMADGLGNAAACRAVGVSRKTGMRWLHGRSEVSAAGRVYSYPPVAPGRRRAVVSDRYLSEAERLAIADQRRCGQSIRSIAAGLGRSPSTVSRELGRNADPAGIYRPFAADKRATARRARPRPGKLAVDEELHAFVQEHLELRWSPEQVSNALRAEFPDQPWRHVVHETIYQALYVQGRGELRRELTRALRTGRARRKPHRRPDARRPGGFVEPMVMISDRPAEVEDRAVPGHWEGDLIMGAGNRSAIGTLVERSTRYVLLLHLPGRHTAEAVRDALVQTVATLPAHLTRSLTWDQGKEMSGHGEFTVATDIPVYFCDPASPWQRGSNENTNGLLRQYFPKGTDLSVYTPEDLAAVAAQLNGRPRKTLSWQTPAERLAELLTDDL
jgi:IS30 family transposase